MNGDLIFAITLVCYLMAFIAAFGNARRPSCILVLIAVAGGVFYLGERCYHSWPMLPMYPGLPALHTGLGICVLWRLWHASGARERRHCQVLVSIVLVLNLLILFFPKDFYLPFIRSATLWAHLFLWAGIIARVLLLNAAICAFLWILDAGKDTVNRLLLQARTGAMWGFIFLSLSMFSGEVWSYLGWGTPVVWHDPALLTGMALWFYWTAVLHMPYARNWSGHWRARFMVAGGLLLLICCHADMGPFQIPFG